MNSFNKTYDFMNYLKINTEEDIKQLLKDKEIDVTSRIQLLAPALVTDQKNYVRTGDSKSQDSCYKLLIHNSASEKTEFTQYIKKERKTMEEMGIWNPVMPKLELFPKFSWFLQFKFILLKSMISKDDEIFCITDNPMHKDKVFKVPMYPASSWKGRLRWVAYKKWIDIDGSAEGRFHLSLLFGDEKGEEEVGGMAAYLDNAHPESKEQYQKMLHQVFATNSDESLLHHASRLIFYSTFLNNIGLEVINPHNRKTCAGRQPIYFECVPRESEGYFSLLFVPHNNINHSVIDIIQDLRVTVEAITQMFLLYGFGAKTSSGFGIAKSELADGKLILKAEGIEVSQKEETKIQEPKKVFKKYLNEDGSVKEEFKGSGNSGLLSNKQYMGEKGQQLGEGSLSEFKKFRRWYADFGEQWQKHIQSEETPGHEWPTWSFESFDELMNVAGEIEKSLKSEGEI